MLPSAYHKILMHGHLLIQAPDMRVYNRDENGVWDGVRWDGQHPAFFALGETDEGKAMVKLRRMQPKQED